MREFSAFMEGYAQPPKHIEEALFAKIRVALNPDLPLTFTKFFLFHVFGSLVTLLFCPQFGISLIDSLGVIPGYLMKLSPGICFFGCGLLWMVGGQALTYLLFTMDEQRVLSRYRLAGIFTILLLSLLLFGCLGSLRLDEWLLSWALGAGAVTFSFNWPIVRTLRRFRAYTPTIK